LVSRTAKRYKFDPDRCLDGMCVGLVDSATEVDVMTPQGVVRARSFKRKPETAAWDVEQFRLAVEFP
jgi:hypothetical protein